jgi:DNA-binding transcriptional LysR family regulator
VAQPALSAQIQKLEAEVGAPLFTRDRRHVALTDVGRMVLEEARETIAHAERTLEVGRSGASGSIGRLAIGYGRYFPFRPVSAIVKRFHAQRPQVAIELRELAARTQFESIASGDLDLGFSLLREELPAELDTLQVSAEPAMAVFSSAHRLADQPTIDLRELADEGFILMHDQDGPESHAERVKMACRGVGFEPKVAQEAVDIRIVLGLVAADLGVTLLSGAMRELHVEGVSMVEIVPGQVLQYGLVWRRDNVAGSVATFVDIARMVCPGDCDAEFAEALRAAAQRAVAPG